MLTHDRASYGPLSPCWSSSTSFTATTHDRVGWPHPRPVVHGQKAFAQPRFALHCSGHLLVSGSF
eukprot:8569955-Heterocapsa_arctica.AAC.1